jgi:hypothetical protein
VDPTEIALVISLSSALASVLGLAVAFAALRLSAASVPLDFRFHLPGDTEERARDSQWVTGWLTNAGSSCKVTSFNTIDWEPGVRFRRGEEPAVAERGDPRTYPVPEQRLSERRLLGLLRGISKRTSDQHGLFYPRHMPTGREARVKVRMPPTVQRIELAVGVHSRITADRAYTVWIDNPLYNSSARSGW